MRKKNKLGVRAGGGGDDELQYTCLFTQMELMTNNKMNKKQHSLLNQNCRLNQRGPLHVWTEEGSEAVCLSMMSSSSR